MYTVLLNLISGRKTQLPPPTIVHLIKFFLLGVLGYAHHFGNIGLALSNPTLSSVMSNLLPATTFVLAVCFRFLPPNEFSLQFEPSMSSQAKIIGTVLSITGASIVVLFKGPAIITSHAHNNLLHSAQSDWIAACAALAAQYVIASIWYTCQAKLIQEYPAEVVLIFFYNVSCTILSLVDCVITIPNFDAWKVQPDVRLVSIIYAGTLGTGLSILIHAWAIHLKGPVYVALFMPMTIAIAGFMSVILLGESLSLGCIIGSIIITTGFYTVVWGKSKEEIGDEPDGLPDVESSPNSSSPLLKAQAGAVVHIKKTTL